MPNILIMTSIFGGGHVFRDVAIDEELKKILPPDFEIIFALGGKGIWEMSVKPIVRSKHRCQV